MAWHGLLYSGLIDWHIMAFLARTGEVTWLFTSERIYGLQVKLMVRVEVRMRMGVSNSYLSLLQVQHDRTVLQKHLIPDHQRFLDIRHSLKLNSFITPDFFYIV